LKSVLAMEQLPLAIGPRPRPTLQTFVVGDNGAAVAHLSTLPMPGAALYLWGQAGCGKSHLLFGLAARCLDQGQQVGWFAANQALPWVLDPQWSLVVVDDCERLGAAAQHAAFVLFNEAASEGVQFAAAGALPPVDLPLREDLRTRLGWGHVFALQPLQEAQTRSALRQEADRRGIFLSDEVMAYLMQRLPRDLGHLMLLLDKLDDFALARGRRVTVPLVRQLLDSDPLPTPTSPQDTWTL